jgi:hypothetical protein
MNKKIKCFLIKLIGVDIEYYNALQQKFDNYKKETNDNFKKWFAKMPIGYAVFNKNASSNNKKIITNGKGTIAFSWVIYEPSCYLIKHLNTTYSKWSHELAEESILFDIYKQNLLLSEEENLVTKAVINNIEYKFFYNLTLFEDFGKKQYNSTMDEIDALLSKQKGESYKINR